MGEAIITRRGGGNPTIKMVSGTVSTSAVPAATGLITKITGTIAGLAIKPVAVAVVGKASTHMGGVTIIGNGTLRSYAQNSSSSYSYIVYNGGNFSATFDDNSITFTTSTLSTSLTPPTVTYHVFGY